MNLTADYLLGRRYRFVMGEAPEFTVVSVNPNIRQIRIHALDGGRWWLEADTFHDALCSGILVESNGPPFTLRKED